MTFSCWQLAEFNLKAPIALSEKLGLIKICHADDGTLMLVGKDEAVAPEPGKPVAIQFAGLDSILGFVLDIGIRRTKWLTGGSGYYWGQSVRPAQSTREVTQKDFSEGSLAWMAEAVNVNFQSADKKKATEAIRCQQLIDTYNDGRLMYPNFHSETYLSMLRIIEAVAGSSGRYEFATAAAQLSLDLNRKIVTSIDAVAAYKARSDIARAKFKSLLADSKLKPYHAVMKTFDDAAQVVFVCFVSAYVYRNKFMHAGFPIPASVKDAFGEDGAGTRYLPASTGLKWTRMLRADGILEDDLVDLHDLIDAKDLQEFTDTYTHVLPTWYFLRTYAREAILQKLEALCGTSRP